MLVCCGEIKGLFTVRTITRNAKLTYIIIAKKIEILHCREAATLITEYHTWADAILIDETTTYTRAAYDGQKNAHGCECFLVGCVRAAVKRLLGLARSATRQIPSDGTPRALAAITASSPVFRSCRCHRSCPPCSRPKPLTLGSPSPFELPSAKPPSPGAPSRR